jgi:tRNA threonylcarbamoyladenosine biosynthesis protein TsaE
MKKDFTISDIPNIARALLLHVTKKEQKTATLVTLTGDLGAGKTSLVQVIAKKLGVTETVQSPTFVILKRYPLSKKSFLGARFSNLIHIDAYRLVHESELIKLGWNEILADQKNLIFLEWPERIPGIIPKKTHTVSLEHKGEHRRISW